MTGEPPIDLAKARRQVRATRAKETIRDAVGTAAAVDPQAAEVAARGGGAWLDMTTDGLFSYAKGKLPQLITGYFQVLAQTYDADHQAWGMLLEFKDRDGNPVQIVATRDQFVGESLELVRLLARRGLTVKPGREAANNLNEYLAGRNPPDRARIVNRTGWHLIEGTRVFVLPDRVAGDVPMRIIHHSALTGVSPFSAAGELAAWQRSVAGPCVGNSRLVFALSAAFTGPLLDLVGEDGWIVHLRGRSRSGKSTAARAAASVWGYAGSGSRTSFVRLWRSTGVGLEETAALHSDAFLVLDELGAADAKELDAAVYFLAAGQGRIRGARTQGLRETTYFRMLALSTGEIGLSDKLAEGGKRPRAGQELRLLEIDAVASDQHGVFEDLHGAASPAAFSGALVTAAMTSYGTAGPAFLDYLVRRAATEPALGLRLGEEATELARGWLAPYRDAGGQVVNAARRFALIAIAGELATEAGVTGWPQSEATEGVAACFRAWLSARGFVGAREDQQAVAQLRAFVLANGKSRFEVWPDTDPARQVEGDHPGDRVPVVNRAGWRRWTKAQDGSMAWRYYLMAGSGEPPTGMRDALRGLDYTRALRVLTERGFVIGAPAGSGGRSIRVSGHGVQRLYEVHPSLFEAADD